MNQEYTVTLNIKEENVKNRSTVFEASQILPQGHMCESSDPNKESMVEDCKMSISEVNLHFKKFYIFGG